jgi:hypothetical protein
MKTHTAASMSLPFELGEPQSHAGLTIVPLFAERRLKLEYLGLDEAVARGLVVEETGFVEELLVQNPLDELVLLYEGEELVGAKQNRILARSALVGASSKLKIPVNCVEQGRWSHRFVPRFEPAPRAAYPQLRMMSRMAGQGAVWNDIASKSARLAAATPTQASEAMYVKRHGSLEEYAEALPRRDGQCGAIVGIAGEIRCLDFVGRSDVFAGLYAKLLRGYALEAIERPLDKALEGVERFLAAIDREGARLVPAVGVGTEARLDGAVVVGTELSAHGEVVTLTAFPR